MAKTILVTGAAGFLGSHICKELLNRKYEVIGVDNLLGGDKANIPFLNNFYINMELCIRTSNLILF